LSPAGPLGLFGLPPRFEFSPLNARRWRNFKSTGAGYWSLWIFLVLFVVSMFAELIANDKPLFIHFDGQDVLSGPRDLSGYRVRRTIFGTAADYRDPHLQKFLDEHNAIEIWPPIHFSYKHHQPTIRRRLFPPSRPGC